MKPRTLHLLSVRDVQEKIEKGRREYNMSRPHSALGNLTSCQSAEQIGIQNTALIAGPVFG